MNYASAVDHLYGLGPELQPPGASPRVTLRKFDLAHMRTLCSAAGDPQKRFPAVLIAGTNGKGSTAANLASILTAAGYRTGLYTSPHLQRVNERIQVAHPVFPSEYGSAQVHASDGPLRLQQISDDDFARLYSQVDDLCESLVEEGRLPILPSFFERLTAVAFLYFAGEGATPPVELAVLEVGLGGRLDATNVVEPLISVITDVALDHQEYLGNSIAEIAREKCGILRPRGTLVTLPQHPEANLAVGAIATELEVRAFNAAAYLPPADRNDSRIVTGELARNRYTLSIEEGPQPELLTVDSPLPGVHQRRNLALAIAAALRLKADQGFDIPMDALERGIRDTCWPGRLEQITPNLLLDVAHNPAGAWTLRDAISSLAPERPRTLLFSCLKDKDLQEMARILFPLFDSSCGDPLRARDHIVLAPLSNPRAATIENLIAAAEKLQIPAHAAPHLPAALAQARAVTPGDGWILATGSVYLVGEVRTLAEANEPEAEHG